MNSLKHNKIYVVVIAQYQVNYSQVSHTLQLF